MVWVYRVFRRMFSVYEKTLSVRENCALSLDKNLAFPTEMYLQTNLWVFLWHVFSQILSAEKSLTSSVWVVFILCPMEHCQSQICTKPPCVRHLNHLNWLFLKATSTRVATPFLTSGIYFSDVSRFFSASMNGTDLEGTGDMDTSFLVADC